MTQQPDAMHAGEAVAEAIRREDVGAVYSVPGSHIHPIYDGLSRVEGLRFVTVKMEPNASLMADAYGRLTGKPGVCVVTAGPGAINSMAGVAQAYSAASPMVHISGAVPLDAHREAFHGVDDPNFVNDMFKPITKWTSRVQKIEDIPEVLAKAFHIARSGRPGPVHVELPRVADYSEHILQEEKAILPPYRVNPTVVARPDPADVERFGRSLLAARAPVIAAGKGVIRQGGTRQLADLAERLQAPVVFAQDAIGVIAEDHPFSAGHFGGIQPHPICGAVLARADVVLCIGTRMATAEMAALGARVADEKMIVIGFDDKANEGYRGANQRIADPVLFLNALLEWMGNEHRPRDDALINQMAEAKASIRNSLAEQTTPHRAEKPIYPGLVMQAMNSVLDDQAVVASDVGNCQMWARLHRRIANPESFMQSGAWNAMSFALPSALVAKMEFPERDVVALAGDGAFLMTIGDLPTAAEYGANIVMVVMNNGTFGQTFMQQQNIYGHTFGTSFDSPDFAAMARACGAEGIRVTEPNDIEDALRAGLAATKDRPALIDVVIADHPYPKMPSGLMAR